MRLQSLLMGAAVSALIFIGSGCGGGANGTVKMENKTAQGLTLQSHALTASARSAPGYLGMKIIAIYLGSTKTDGHVPSETTLWFHPDCLVPAGEGDGSKSASGKEAHIARCGIEKGGTASNTEKSWVDHQVKSYINLARSTADVNAQLAAEALEIRPGTYKYVAVAMADPGNAAEGAQEDEDGVQTLGQVPSVKFWHSDMGGALSNGKPPLEYSARYKSTKVWVSDLAEPLVVEAGDKVEFTLSYDLSQAYWNGASCADHLDQTDYSCSQTPINEKSHFIQLPTLQVSVTKSK